MSAPAEPAPPIAAPGLLLACEGADDEAFLRRMLGHQAITDVAVRQYRGKPQLPTFLLGRRDSSEFESIRAVGILRDADTSAARSFQSVRDRLRQLELPAPRSAGQLASGECSIDGLVRTIGVFIVPDGVAAGALEDLCLRAVRVDGALACVDTFLACVHQQTGVRCPDAHRPKARLNAWQASRHDPGLRIGYALAAGDIPPDSPAFDKIRGFLRRLAEAATPDA